MAGKKFGSDFDLIPDVKSNDSFLVEDSDDGVVKKAHPSQIWQKFDDLDTSVAAAAQSASDAADSEANALSYKNAAAGSANDALGYKNDAAGSASDAHNSEVAAAGSANDALGYKNAAAGSASDAHDSELAAAASAVVAGDKADDAAASAASARESADEAADSAASIIADKLKSVVDANAYGIEFYDTGSNLSVTRVGEDMNLHKPLISKGLPVQKKMRRFLMLDDGTNNGYLLGNDSRFKANGAVADLSGADGQVMVELPKYAFKCWIVGTDSVTGNDIYRFLMMDAAVIDVYVDASGNNPLWEAMQADGWVMDEKISIAAFLMADKSSSRAIGGAAGTSVCAKDRIAFLDSYGLIVRETGNIEYPNHSISDGSHRKYSSVRSAEAAATLRRPSFVFSLASNGGAAVSTSAPLPAGKVFLLTDTESDGAVRYYLLRNDSGVAIASGTSVSVNNFASLGLTDVGDWHAHLMAAQKKLCWLFAVEYASFNWQKAFNAAVDANGYRQGGLGDGFTSGLDFMGDGSGWSNNNAYSVPNGCTLGLGNESGEVVFYPSKEGQAMRRWAVNRGTELPSVEVVATSNGGSVNTTAECADGGFVIVRDTVGSTTTEYVLQNTSGAPIAAGASVSKTGGTGFTAHSPSDSDYIYCIVEYGNIGVPSNSVPASGIILPVGAHIFVQGYNADGTGKLFVFTNAVTADGVKSVEDFIDDGDLIEAIAEPDAANVKVGQLVFDYATMGDSSSARGYWRCTAAGTFGVSGTGTFVYVQDEYHYDHINSYRGVEFPFGYVWQCAADVLFDRRADSTLDVWKADLKYLKAVISNNSVLTYTAYDASNMSDANRAIYLNGKRWKKAGLSPAASGYIKAVGLGDDAETMPKVVNGGASASTYFYDYFYTQNAGKPTGNLTSALLGGAAGYGAPAGGFLVLAYRAVGHATADFGSRLCHE